MFSQAPNSSAPAPNSSAPAPGSPVSASLAPKCPGAPNKQSSATAGAGADVSSLRMNLMSIFLNPTMRSPSGNDMPNPHTNDPAPFAALLKERNIPQHIPGNQ